MKRSFWPIIGAGTWLTLSGQPALAHDPVFGIGPHVLFKDGFEAAIQVAREKTGDKKASELGLEIVYGITGDWAAGIEVPYAFKDKGDKSSSGLSDIQVFTKYRFWREDSLGRQESAAVMLAINADNGDETTDPRLGNGATDIITALTYGYESLKWYRWASVRHLRPGENAAGLQKGSKWLLDFVGGWRPTPPEYKKPDTVWLLEINAEYTNEDELNGSTRANSGGMEWFVSPGIFWTTRNFAIKTGVQFPIASNLNGTQDESDYRVKASFEWHF